MYQVASIKYQEIGYEVPRRLYEVLSTRYQDLFGGESRFQSGFPTSTFDTRRSSFNISLDLVFRLPAEGR